MSYTLPLLFTLVALFAAQSFALRLSGGRTLKSESNYFSSLGRLQEAARGESRGMLLGSSITGRLPDRHQGFPGWSNMGCDGGSAVDALRAMDANILPAAPLLVIEANTLHMPLEKSVVQIEDTIRSAWFRLGLKVPAIASYSRPSAILYSKLLVGKIGSIEGSTDFEDLGVAGRPMMITDSQTIEMTPGQEELIEEVRGILERLRQRGSHAVIVWLPPTRKHGSETPMWILEMARRCGVPYWDLGQQVTPGTVKFTDGVHMAPASAARTMRSLEKAMTTR